MADRRRRDRDGRRNGDRSIFRGTLLSAALHALAIVLVLLAPHRMRAAPPTAYTVELVDPNALGGKLLAGPIGGGAASHRAAPAPPPPAPPPPPPPPPPPEPEQVAKVEPPPEPAREEDPDAIPIGTATPAPRPTRVASPRATATARPVPKPSATPVAVVKPKATASPIQRAAPKPTASPAAVVNAKPTASPVSLARGRVPTAAPSPASRADARDARGAAAREGDLDSRLAAAIKGVASRDAKEGTPGLAAGGPGGGQGGTERTLNGPAGVGGEGPGGGGTVRGLEFVVYYNQMLTRIKESWTYVGERSDLRVTVRFSILDSGEITDIRLTERSGDAGYDASVERAVKRASPLSRPPEAYRKDFADVELTFRPADLRRPSG